MQHIIAQHAAFGGFAAAAAFTPAPTAGQLLPRICFEAAVGMVGVTRPVDRLRAHRGQAPGVQVRGDRVRRPVLLQPISHLLRQHRITSQLRGLGPSRVDACSPVGTTRAIVSPATTGEFSIHRGPVTTQPTRYLINAQLSPTHRLDPRPLIETQTLCHNRNLHRSGC